MPEAVVSLLAREEVDVNSQSSLGSCPALVAAKYASTEALQVSLKLLLEVAKLNQ